MINRICGYWRRAQFEYSQWRWRRYFAVCRLAFDDWHLKFTRSNAEVLLGMHLHKHGGVRNHLLAIQRYSGLRVLLVPEERELQSPPGPAFLKENLDRFLQTTPPCSAVAVHTHVLPDLIRWAELHAPNRMRWVHTHHLLYYDDTQPGGMREWQRELNAAGLHALRSCDAPLVVSRSQQRDLKMLHGVDAFYLPNGVDVASCDRGSGATFRRRFAVGENFVLWMGGNEIVKNPRELLLAAAELPFVQFVMAGCGCSARELLASTGCRVPSNVVLTGALSREMAQDALAACRALCVTSLREGLPTLILEAMAHRRRIITSDAEGCLDATDGDRFATVYKRGDVSGLCEAIQRTLLEPQDVETARQRVLDEFDWGVVARKLDQIYKGAALK